MNRDARHVLSEFLVLRAQAGEDRAFTELFHLWNRDLRRMARLRVGSDGHAEEIAQDAWVTIARSLHRLLDPACFPRWAFRILERRSADWIRQRQADRRRTEHLTTLAPPPNEIMPPDVSGGTAGEAVSALREAIAALDPDARTLLHLFYELGFTIAEIAEILDVPAGTVKSRLFTLRQSLKAGLERTTT